MKVSPTLSFATALGGADGNADPPGNGGGGGGPPNIGGGPGGGGGGGGGGPGILLVCSLVVADGWWCLRGKQGPDVNRIRTQPNESRRLLQQWFEVCISTR